MLLALGLDVPAGFVEPAEFIVQAGLGGIGITSFSIERSVEMIDVTTYGDSTAQFIPSTVRATFIIEGIVQKHFNPFLDELHFDEVVGGMRVKARLFVRECTTKASVDSLTTVRIKVEAIGPVTMESVADSNVSRDLLQGQVRRGILLPTGS